MSSFMARHLALTDIETRFGALPLPFQSRNEACEARQRDPKAQFGAGAACWKSILSDELVKSSFRLLFYF